MVTKIDLGVNKSLLKEIKAMPTHQVLDPVLTKIRENCEKDPSRYKDKHMIRDQVLFCKNARTHPYCRPMLPTNLEYTAIECVYTTLGHKDTDKCMDQISQTFYFKNLGKKVRQFVSRCDVCQRVNHPNRAFEIVSRSHLPTKPGELLTIDLYGPLPTGRGRVKYLLVCLDMFSKHVTLYPLKAATTKACLNKLTKYYFVKVIKPRTILSDHGSQFTSPQWHKTLTGLGIEIKYSPIRHPESNPAERIMRELGKYFRIYCNETHKKKMARTCRPH